MADEQKQAHMGKPRHRSPNYPVLSLPKAVAKAVQMYESYRQSPVPVNVVHEKWGYKAHSGAGNQVVAALRAYGFMDVEGQGEKRFVRLSDVAHKIVAGHPDKDRLLREVALSPTIYAELWAKYKDHGLPPDDTLRAYLQWEKKFNADSIDGIIADFRETIDFAKIGLNGNMASGGNGDGPDYGNADPSKCEENKPLAPPRPVPTTNNPPTMRTDTFFLENGAAVSLQYPAALSEASYQDVEDWLGLELRKIRRLITTERESTNEEQAPNIA